MGDASEARKPSPYGPVPVPNPTASVWQTSHQTPVAHHQSTPELPKRSTVVVIGSGISAAFAVRRLLQLTPSVDLVVLEARGTCSGATGRNGGHLRPSTFGEPREVLDFELANFNFVAEFIEKNSVACELRRLQGCHGFWRREYFEEARTEWLKEERADPVNRTGTRIVDRPSELGSLRLQGALGAFEIGTAASLSPYKLVTWIWEDLLKRYPTLNLQTDTQVSTLNQTSRDSWLVETARGKIEAAHVLIATNGYTSHLLPQFNDLITPVQCWMSALRSADNSPSRSTLLSHSYGMSGVGPQDKVQDDFLVQRPVESGEQYMFGGARAQVKGNGVSDFDDSYVPEEARHYLRSILPRLLNLNESEAKSSEVKSDGEWGGIMGFSRDHYPWVGEVPDMHGVYLSAGFSGHGGCFEASKA